MSRSVLDRKPPVGLDWRSAVCNADATEVYAVASGNRVFAIPLPATSAAPTLSLPASFAVEADRATPIVFVPGSLVDADSALLTLTLALADPATGTLAVDIQAATAAGLKATTGAGQTILRGSQQALQAYMATEGHVSVQVAPGAVDPALRVTASDGSATRAASVPLSAVRPLALELSSSSGAFEVIDLRGNDLRLTPFTLGDTTLGPLADKLTVAGLVEAPLIASAADQALDGDVAMTKQRLAERIQAVTHARGVHQVTADQRVIDQPRHLHAMPLQHDQVELGVVRRLGHRCILEQRLQQQHRQMVPL